MLQISFILLSMFLVTLYHRFHIVSSNKSRW
ncbi:hypothetical protein PI27_gp025 [Listeria phage WIL-1]|nr:hypothetical protein PI27_gp025 [Listeria phage WIL-1]